MMMKQTGGTTTLPNNIHRVVTTFILNTTTTTTTTTTTPSGSCNALLPSQQQPAPIINASTSTSTPSVAIFHRCDTMPTFPSHWAGISGKIEDGETPYHAAQRELSEETNITETVEERGGLYLDVPYVSPRTQEERIIRVYPFVVHVPADRIGSSSSSSAAAAALELRGTEHDRYQMITVDQLEEMKTECVPGLVQAFHRATCGVYDRSINPEIRAWASDVENGASVMVANALKLIAAASSKDENHETIMEDTSTSSAWRIKAEQIAMLRPSMVSICNVMNEILKHGKEAVTVESFQYSLQASVELGIQAIRKLEESKSELNKKDNKLTIATFSRSGTLRQVLTPFLERAEIVCSQSSPGNEGELMASDLHGATCVSDLELKTFLAIGRVDLLLIGTDCILPETNELVNKVGTGDTCRTAQQYQVPVYCCADSWKVWEDKFPPPLEKDLFETVSLDLITELLLPKWTTDNCTTKAA